VVEFIQICDYFMVNDHFHNDLFRASFPPNYCHSFRENQFCKVPFALSVRIPSLKLVNQCHLLHVWKTEIFEFDNLISAGPPFDF